MAVSKLSLIERNVLLVLMAENRPLKESADLKDRHGISMNKRHREALRKQGLIETTPGPFTHKLTRRGWDWAKAETEAPRPRGTSGQGALYAVLSAVGEYVRQNGLKLDQIFHEKEKAGQTDISANGATPGDNAPALPSGRTHAQMLQDADLAEVDEALALLLQDQPVVDRALLRLSKKATPALKIEIEGAKNAINLILQWGRRAAEKRSIIAIGGQGEEVNFDPILYETDEPTKTGSRVLVRRSPIVRKTASGDLVIARGSASAVY
jgi:hypothetical protein